MTILEVLAIMEYNLARRMQFLKASEVRELLKLTERPEILSFAGGLPAPELFPTQELAEHSVALLKEMGAKALQYAATEGYTPLRVWIRERLNTRWGMNVDLDNLLILSGSQSGLDLIAKLFLNDGDTVWCESPTYMAALSAFRVCGAQFQAMDCDDDGVLLEGLEDKLRAHPPKFVYVITNFQNPSGRTWSMERRQTFMELMTRYEIPVVEDNAYYEVAFDPLEYCSLARFDPKGLVLSLGSFSKVLCPGLRVAWVSAHEDLINRLVILKQSTDLQTATFNQMLVHRYLANIDFDARIKLICDTYRERRDAVLQEFEQHAPAGVHFTHPRGGMFIWMDLPEYMDSHQLFNRCLSHCVAFVPGTSFHPVDPKRNTLRFNFSNLPPATIRHGARVLCNSSREEMEAAGR